MSNSLREVDRAVGDRQDAEQHQDAIEMIETDDVRT